MSNTAPARGEARRALGLFLGCLAFLVAACIPTLVYQPASSSAPSFSQVLRGDHGGTTTDLDGAVTEDDGLLPDGVTAFDDEYPGVANLDPALLQALRAAARDASNDGIEIQLNSGWRSAEYQEQLLREAVAEYGSEAEAARWVATANTSAHVSGDAVDIGPFDATAWLSEHGALYGLCRVYGNEPWHYELRPEAISQGCPHMFGGPGRDPGIPH